METVDIFAIGIQSHTEKEFDFLGACIDSGAQRTVIGTKQATSYGNLAGIYPIKEYKSPLQLRFGNITHHRSGMLDTIVPEMEDHFITI